LSDSELWGFFLNKKIRDYPCRRINLLYLSLMNPRLEKLKKEAPDEMPAFVKAAKLFSGMKGISIADDDRALKEIIETLNFTPKTLEGETCKANMLREAKKKSRQGMFGDGVFLID